MESYFGGSAAGSGRPRPEAGGRQGRGVERRGSEIRELRLQRSVVVPPVRGASVTAAIEGLGGVEAEV